MKRDLEDFTGRMATAKSARPNCGRSKTPAMARRVRPVPQTLGCLPRGFNLDSLLTVEQFAAWRQVAVSTVKSQISAGLVNAIQHSQMDVRIHPRSYLHKMRMKF